MGMLQLPDYVPCASDQARQNSGRQSPQKTWNLLRLRSPAGPSPCCQPWHTGAAWASRVWPNWHWKWCCFSQLALNLWGSSAIIAPAVAPSPPLNARAMSVGRALQTGGGLSAAVTRRPQRADQAPLTPSASHRGGRGHGGREELR